MPGRHGIPTTHTGSLPRPAELTRLLVERERGGTADPAALEEQTAAALRAVVVKQREAGIDIANDGEQQREAYFLYVRHRLSGFGGHWSRPPLADVIRYPGFTKVMQDRFVGRLFVDSRQGMPTATGEVRHLGTDALLREIAAFRRALADTGCVFDDLFLTAPSPGIIAAGMRNEHYDTEDAYFDALAAAMAAEYEAIVGAGLMLQLDCPDLGVERHCSFQDRPLPDFLAFAERAVAALNRALANVPPERVRMHVCWGNYEAPHDLDVPLADTIAIITQARVGALMLPFANPRHAHEHRCLSQLRDDQTVVAGVIDPLTNFVEHPEVVADRIELAARALGDPGRVCAGTDCGFDSSAGVGRVAADVVWAKLASLAAGAERAASRLHLA